MGKAISSLKEKTMTKKTIILSFVFTFSFIFSVFLQTQSTAFAACNYIDSGVTKYVALSGCICEDVFVKYTLNLCCSECKGSGTVDGKEDACEGEVKTDVALDRYINGELSSTSDHTCNGAGEDYQQCTGGTKTGGDPYDVTYTTYALGIGAACNVHCTEE